MTLAELKGQWVAAKIAITTTIKTKIPPATMPDLRSKLLDAITFSATT